MKAIATALVRAKREFQPAVKNAINPHLKNRYADLLACLEAVNTALLAQGIYLYQETSEDASGVTVETIFLHESGESLHCGKLHVPASKADAQGYGSALSYARRYSLITATGIAAEDDDGNAASRQVGYAAQEPVRTAPPSEKTGVSAKQQGLICGLMQSHVITPEERNRISDKLEAGTADGKKIIDWLQSEIKARKEVEKAELDTVK